MIEVGKPYEPIARLSEGVYFDLDDSGARLIYHFARPTEKEIAAMQSGKDFEIKMTELRGILWIVSKCGALNWTDAPYNPRASLLSDSFPRTGSGDGIALQLIMSDARTAEVKSLRLIGLGAAFSAALLEAAQRLRVDGMAPSDVQSAIDEVMQTYSTTQIASMASHRYKLRG